MMIADSLLRAFSVTGDDTARIQQLRKVVVASAVAGKLYSDSAVFSPREMAQVVEEVKANLFKRRVISKPKKFQSVDESELPEGFLDASRFAPLGSLAQVKKGMTGIKQALPGPFPLVVTSAERASCDHFDFEGAAAIIPLVSSTGHGHASLNRLHYQEGRFALGTILAAVFPYDSKLVSARFIFEYLSAFREDLLVTRMTGTANVTLSIGRISEVPVPLIDPMIQAKVDELMALLDQLEAARADREATRDRLTAASLARLTAPDAEAEDFTTHARFALDALPALTARPDQIKQLRQAILDLAVRGKLVEQDPEDEPASELLKRIAAEKKRKGIKQSIFPLDDEEILFELPASWSWTRIGEICSKTGSGSTPSGGKGAYKTSGVPFLRSQNVYNEGLRLEGVAFIDTQTHERMKGTRVLSGDLLLNITGGSMGRCGRVPDDCEEANISQHVAIIRLAVRGMDRFLHNLILSPYFQAFIFDKQTGAGRGGLPKNRLDKIAVPLPPLAEQHRIVAKVDALMALCDRLEAALATTDTTQQKLLEAVLSEALTPSDAVAVAAQ